MIYLYNYAGESYKTQYWVREALNRLYKPTPDGYCGDEDNGQTSAWYVFSAIGFYPVCPGTDQYVLGAPLFKKVTLNLDGGKKFVITAPGNSVQNRYVSSQSLNSKPYKRTWLSYVDIVKGGMFTTTMSATPNKARVTTAADLPYSFSKDDKAIYNKVKDIQPGGLAELAKLVNKTDTITRNGLTLYFMDEDRMFSDDYKKRFVDAYFLQYPKLISKYNLDSKKAVKFFIDGKYEGVAEAYGNTIRYNPAWFEKNPEDIDVITHELMHIVQNYTGNVPGWVTEGVADYVRATEGINNLNGKWTMPDVKPDHSYSNAYRITARFLLWITQRYQKDFVIKLNEAARASTYTADFWKNNTGKNVDELWSEYVANPTVEIIYL